MTDDDLKENKILAEIWPSAKFLLCQFHDLKVVWAWLSDKNNGICKDHRQEMYFLFKDLLNSSTLFKLEMKWGEMQKNALFAPEKATKYFSNLWSKRKLWACSFRLGLPIRGNNTTNYIEALFRVFKERILDRVKALNVVQLTDFILTSYENYLKNRLLDFSYNRYSKKLLKKFNIELYPESSICENISYDSQSDVYTVIGTNGDNWEVDLTGFFCTCPFGSTGKLCKHISAEKFSIEVPSYVNSHNTRVLMYKIAMGRNPINEQFLLKILHITS